MTLRAPFDTDQDPGVDVGDAEVRDGGFVVVEWILGMTLLLVPALLLFGSLPQWAEQQTTARSAAAEGARAAILVNDPANVVNVATVRAREVASNYGAPPGDVLVDVTGTFAPGESITVTVTVTMAAIRIPFGPTVGETAWSASSTERVGDFRTISGGGS